MIQYCSAEIASNSPGAGSWFAANVITDSDFSPKPLTEIFTTERAFLSTNPIIVLPPSSQSTLVDTTTTSETSGTPETSSQSTVSIPPSSDNPAPISTSTITTTFDSSTVTQTAMQIDTVAPVQTGPPATSDTPSQNIAQPNQNFFYIYPGSQIAGVPQPQGQFQTAATTVAPCVTATSAPQPTTVSPASSTIGSAPVTSTQNTTNGFPTIRIRMLSPAGSVTNINFVRGLASSTTVRPRTTTRRNRRRNRNNYDDCIDTCVGRRTPICASPVGRPSISADTLKGFPTMCHMACNNAFRRNGKFLFKSKFSYLNFFFITRKLFLTFVIRVIAKSHFWLNTCYHNLSVWKQLISF